jgi:hypothetical protein
MHYFIAGVVVGGFVAGLPIVLMVYYLRKFLQVFEQDLHEALAHIDVPSTQS